MDPEPVVARQCIKALPPIASEKSLSRGEILEALRNTDVNICNDRMRLPACGDISAALLKIEEMQED